MTRTTASRRSSKPAGSSRKLGYHHGDLRRALLEASLAILAERGVAGLTLREAAQRAGVTHAAPYRHFADKQALLAALAEYGFRRLGESMDAATDAAAPDALARLLALGAAYVRLAEQEPALFRLMYGNEIQDRSAHPGLREADDLAFARLADTIAACQAAGRVRPGDPVRLAMTTWAMVHGLAVGWLDGQLARRGAAGRSAEDVFFRVSPVIFGGLSGGDVSRESAQDAPRGGSGGSGPRGADRGGATARARPQRR